MHRLNVSVFTVLGGYGGVVFGSNDIEHALSEARMYVQLHFANVETRMVEHVEISENCPACEGQGWTQRTPRCKRRKCGACNLGEKRRIVDVFVHRTDVDPLNTRVLAL